MGNEQIKNNKLSEGDKKMGKALSANVNETLTRQ
jgi:hypothetical protein